MYENNRTFNFMHFITLYYICNSLNIKDIKKYD